jgi:hypothetical protein
MNMHILTMLKRCIFERVVLLYVFVHFFNGLSNFVLKNGLLTKVVAFIDYN